MEPDAGTAPPRTSRWEALGAAVLAAAALALYWPAHFRGVRMSDDFEYAHVARNLLRGRGFETQQYNPLDWAFFDAVPHANVLHPPGTPLLIAPSFAVFGVSDLAAVLPMAACFVALAAIVFLVASRLFGRGAAWCAAVVFAIHPGCLQYATVAMSEMPTALLLTSAALAALAANGRAGLAGAGLLCGAAVWFRENAATFVAPVLLIVWQMSDGDRRAHLRRCVPVVAGFAVPVALLSVRCLLAFGRPWFSYSTYHVQGYSSLVEGVELFRWLDPPTFLETLRAHPEVVRTKLLDNVFGAPGTFVEAAGLPATLLLAAHLLLPAARPAAVVKAALGVAIGLHFAAHAVFTNNVRHLVPYVPLVAVFAGAVVSAAARLVRERRDAAGCIAAAIVVALLAFSAQTYRRYCRSTWRVNQWDGLGAWLAKSLPEGAVVATEQWEPVVWYADRCAVVLPVDRAAFDALDRRLTPTHLLVTSRIGLYPKTEWVTSMTGDAAANGWREEGRFDDGKVAATLWARVR